MANMEDRLAAEEHTPQLSCEQQKYSPADFKNQAPRTSSNKTVSEGTTSKPKRKSYASRGVRLAKEWGFEPNARYHCPELGEVMVRYVKGNRLVVAFSDGGSKGISKNEAKRLFRLKTRLLTRRMRKQRECTEKSRHLWCL